MGVTLHLPAEMYGCVRTHVLQNELENAAFLFVQPEERGCDLSLQMVDIHLDIMDEPTTCVVPWVAP